MEGTKARVYEFGPFRLYPDQKLLFKGDQRLDVDRKALAVLEILVQNRGQLVTKERLLKEVWADVSVEEGNVNVHVSKIRRLLGDERKQAEYIETVHGEPRPASSLNHCAPSELRPCPVEEHENQGTTACTRSFSFLTDRADGGST